MELTRDASPTAIIPTGAAPILAGDSAPPRLASARRFGNYELLDKIARGGMGVVDRARQIGLDRLVAVKMLLSGPRASPDLVRAGDILTLSGVPHSSRLRMGVDRDANGTLDGDETLPRLSATLLEAGLQLSWPNTTLGVVLETSDTLNAGSRRAETRNHASSANDSSVRIPADRAQRFYRLRRL